MLSGRCKETCTAASAISCVQVGDVNTGIFSSKVYRARTLPVVGPATFPFPIGLVCLQFKDSSSIANLVMRFACPCVMSKGRVVDHQRMRLQL